MFGAAIGDIVGSRFEWDNIKTKDFEFLHAECLFTDDTVCTAAVAEILMHEKDPAQTMQAWCRQYPGRGYGGHFAQWIEQDNPRPYASYGNGAAMRVSPAALLNRGDLGAAIQAADRVTMFTHNHAEGVKGARAATHAIWLALNGAAAGDIRKTVAREYGYDLSATVDAIRPEYGFDETCQGSVPQAVICALESTSFEDAVRNAVSIGGDSDTIAAIAGAIGEGLHGIDESLIRAVCGQYLDKRIGGALRAMYA